MAPQPGRWPGWAGSLGLHLAVAALLLAGWGLSPPMAPTTPEVIEVALLDPPAPPEEVLPPEAVEAPQAPPEPGRREAAPADRLPQAARPVPAPPRQAPPKPAAATPRQAPPVAARPRILPPPQGELQSALERREAAARARQAALAAAAAAAAAAEGAGAAPPAASPGPGTGQSLRGRPDIEAGGVQGELAGRGLLRRIEPSYPASMEAAQDEGSVRCRLVVGPDGEVQEVVVVGPSGRGAFDAAAVGALRRWRFTPLANLEGPLQAGEVTVSFHLR